MVGKAFLLEETTLLKARFWRQIRSWIPGESCSRWDQRLSVNSIQGELRKMLGE